MSVTPPPQGSALDQVLGDATVPPEEYVSIAALSKRIPYAPQTIRNLMSSGVLKLDVHYLKPRGRIIFRWSAVRAWLEGQR